jgi:hypothetical protein
VSCKLNAIVIENFAKTRVAVEEMQLDVPRVHIVRVLKQLRHNRWTVRNLTASQSANPKTLITPLATTDLRTTVVARGIPQGRTRDSGLKVLRIPNPASDPGEALAPPAVFQDGFAMADSSLPHRQLLWLRPAKLADQLSWR